MIDRSNPPANSHRFSRTATAAHPGPSSCKSERDHASNLCHTEPCCFWRQEESPPPKSNRGCPGGGKIFASCATQCAFGDASNFLPAGLPRGKLAWWIKQTHTYLFILTLQFTSTQPSLPTVRHHRRPSKTKMKASTVIIIALVATLAVGECFETRI